MIFIAQGVGHQQLNQCPKPDQKVFQYLGETLNGKPHGQGTMFYIIGGKAYDGNYSSGLFEGRGILYYLNQQKAFDGIFQKGQKFRGIEHYMHGSISYEGEFQHGKRDGYGCSYFPNGHKNYEGQWQAGFYHGIGTIYDRDSLISYQGGLNKNLKDQFGSQSIDEDISYSGYFSQGKKEGSFYMISLNRNIACRRFFKDDQPFYKHRK
ncbi:morn repeat protein [Stylonychia lemnae]|uniref:Morn repeat protein n=1 Tax=Stylonychia lemnae TaxID=5949 RepID=A0A078APU2_STYLE|nr:morn repeat protein [Stylonychia lemnae]|eukprot:CDW82953.1 morn repeat protein [Stylonychia lemnae]